MEAEVNTAAGVQVSNTEEVAVLKSAEELPHTVQIQIMVMMVKVFAFSNGITHSYL